MATRSFDRCRALAIEALRSYRDTGRPGYLADGLARCFLLDIYVPPNARAGVPEAIEDLVLQLEEGVDLVRFAPADAADEDDEHVDLTARMSADELARLRARRPNDA
jgi:hypothetical protein